MDYPLENLDPESFQQLCQALLAKELPHVQCFPVGQPDGGRDAVVYLPRARRLDFQMYQVKYVRKPQAEKDPHRWLTSVVEDEAPKIAKMIPKGAQRFVIITNVSGTGHASTGAIDRVNEILAANIAVPAEVWWRDDINRRLDSSWDLKWAYPQLMTGPDLIRGLVENGLLEDKERRTNAIRVFISAQFSDDEQVRFKQVELQNRLLAGC